MALSKSIARAQDVMVCQLCESDPKLKWKCVDCGLLMCIKCTAKIHPKFKNAKDHTILDIKQLGQIGIQKEIDINNVQCKIHSGQTCCLYCSLCKLLVCLLCVTKGHTGHKFEEIKDISGDDVENIIKGLQNVAVTRATKLKLRVRRHFTAELDQCLVIQTGHDGSLWILDNYSPPPSHHVLQHVKPQNENLQTLLSIDTKTMFIMDFRILSTGDVLVADKTSTLKIINGRTGKVTNSKFNVKSLFITAVHVTDDEKILIATRSTESAFPVSGRRVVIMMDTEGKKEAEWEYDKNTKQIFSSPRKLTCSKDMKDGKIFVIDEFRSEDFSGRIVVLSYDGVVNTYIGHPDINNDETPFEPVNLVNTPSDNIIVCVLNIDILYYLDNSGNFLSIFDTTTIGIDLTYCLTFLNHDAMLIGCTSIKGSTDKAKLYELEFSETE